MLKMPRLLVSMLWFIGALVWPLYVTVKTPLPGGVFDGNSAATWLSEVYNISAFTVVPFAAVTAIDVPLRLVFWKGFESKEIFAGPRPVPLITKMPPSARERYGTLLAAF